MSISFQAFDWQTAPLSDFRIASFAAVAYVTLVLVHYSSEFIQKAVTIKNTKTFVSIHNLILMFASLVMFIGCFREVIIRSIEEKDISW